MNMPEKPFIYNYKRLEEPRNSRIRRPRRNLQRIVSSFYSLNPMGANNRASPPSLLRSYAGHGFAEDCVYCVACHA